MRIRDGLAAIALGLLCGCAASPAAPAPTSPPRVIVVTPTAIQTRVPTVVRAAATDAPAADIPVRAPLDPADCAAAVLEHYTAASDLCLAGDSGTICNGGAEVEVLPQSARLRANGGVASLDSVNLLRAPPAADDAALSLVWLRMASERQADALLVGAAELRNLSSRGDSWRAMTMRSGESSAGCDAIPPVGALVLQSRYGQTARLNINGLETANRRRASCPNASEDRLFHGYRGHGAFDGGRAQPGIARWHASQPGLSRRRLERAAESARRARIARLRPDQGLAYRAIPRPLPIPQPGYARTQGGVNLRAAPDISGLLRFQVPAGQTMSALGISRDGEWLHVRLGNGEMGWMSAGLLSRNLGEIAHVYDEAPPPPQRLGKHANSARVNVPAGGNLRAAPDTAFRILRTLPLGEEVKLLSRSPYSPWAKVQAGDAVGWMALFTLTTQSVIGSLPIDYQAPLPPRVVPTPVFSFGGGHAYPDPNSGY